jgi:hypothetical protein
VLTGVVAVVVVVLIVAGITLSVRRRGGDEVHSVEGYRSTLHTLEEVRTRSSAVRVLPRAGEEAGGAPAGTVAAAGAGEGAAGTGGPPAADGEGAVTTPFGEFQPPAGQLAEGSRYLRDTPRQRRRAMASMNHGPRRLAAPIVAGVVVLGAVAALAVVGARTHKPGSGGSTSANHATSTTAPHGGTSPASQHHGTTHRTHATTTTAPTSFTPQTSAAGAVTYVPPAPSFVLQISTPNGPCWVHVTTQPAGTVVFSQTLPAGSSQQLSLTGANTVELGAPGATSITLDGTPVVLPANYNIPLTLTFAPAPAGT